METFKGLSRGTQIVLTAGPLLFFGLFFIWQMVEIDYGPAGITKRPQDGLDAWGLLIAMLVITTVTLVVLADLTDVEMSEEVPWDTVTLVLGCAVFLATVVKNLTDANSTWASYAFVAVAGAFAAGTYLNWAESRRREEAQLERKRREVSSAA
jgi:uncharacterized membrane protein